MKNIIKKPAAKTAKPAGIYRIKAGSEVVTKLRNRRFEDRKKKASARYCRSQDRNPDEAK